MGEAASNGGFPEDVMDKVYPRRADIELQRLVDEQVQLDDQSGPEAADQIVMMPA